MKKISTSALAKKHNIQSKEFFLVLFQDGYIQKNDGLGKYFNNKNTWLLTTKGKEIGGEYKTSERFGEYIVWPENITLSKDISAGFITASKIGQHFNIAGKKINLILSELGWIQKDIKGWKLTKQGKSQKGIQDEDKTSGIPYVRWSENILESKILIETISELKGEHPKKQEPDVENQENTDQNPETKKVCDFRSKFPATHRPQDGHMVRSRGEMLIDDFLYQQGIVHAYERKVPIEEDMYCDFWLPTGKVYIEYWGIEDQEKYKERKRKKKELYEKYELNLIELSNKDVENLDDVLPRLLLKHGILIN